MSMLFKNQYYYFVAGLPELFFDMTRLPLTLEEFKTELYKELKKSDRKLIDTYFLNYDNKNFLAFLNNPEHSFNTLGSLDKESFAKALNEWESKGKNPGKNLPKLYNKFFQLWFEKNKDEDVRTDWETILTQLYIEYGLEVKNSLISRWFEFNLNIGNILSAIYARKYKLNISNSLVGDNLIVQKIRENNLVKDFGLGEDVPYIENVLRVAEEEDIYERERKIDKIRWDWLEENTIFDYFNIEYLFAYLCKLQILERWVNLNAEEGERVFRELIQNLKKEVTVSDELMS